MWPDWNPTGHPPEAIYGLPHFDVHIHLVDERAAEAIGPGAAEYAIPDRQTPPGYVTADALGAPRVLCRAFGERTMARATLARARTR
ncbi:hypothetical protein [Halegenticoccus soli]|uniref:hypothetical protein n=1 Tax=Halegenticoccus soli TaxID=1985678 RepID=UPI000C6ED68C|nr:hypothetical protein [Halegenticoccus soli]